MAPTKLLPATEVLAQAQQLITPVGSETLSLAHASGRVSAASVYSPAAVPSAATSMMDGFAARSAELPRTLQIVGTASAGSPWSAEVPPGACVAIATGAWVPVQLDTVIPIEEAQRAAEQIRLPATAAGSWIRPAESELARGDEIIAAGQRLSARRLALLASLGIARLKVHHQPRIGVLATGDELRQAGAALAPGSIYDANRPQVLALLARCGCIPVDLGTVRDKRDELTTALQDGSTSCAAIITIGGASVGERDLLADVVTELGTLQAWKVAIKPGKPFMLGLLGDTPLFGLPGNPASVFVTFIVLVLPALWCLAGYAPLPQLPWHWAHTVTVLAKVPGREDYQRGLLKRKDNDWEVRPVTAQHSAALHPLADANCLIRLPLEAGNIPAGTAVEVLPLALLD